MFYYSDDHVRRKSCLVAEFVGDSATASNDFNTQSSDKNHFITNKNYAHLLTVMTFVEI